ncbi:polymeric immunoglobulin receptor-like [Toxotes jaculatrix]|uniref:polymeric immunoglobulin receptor-like n=1 Tax=Toxotes jaculatrix TaxID=941984 RepID=UPI001B3ACC6A|nr:polymeric immunoglobulin receptor-like [Toxotes jaculatrix]
MKVSHTLICCLVLSLLDGDIALVGAQEFVYSAVEGEAVKVKCSFSVSGSRRIFCREPCQPDDFLIDTTDVRAQRDRYSIEYKWERNKWHISVSITHLTKSDSGKYRCGLGSTRFEYEKLEIIVTDALLEETHKEKTVRVTTGADVTVECSFPFSSIRKNFCKGDCEGKNILVETRGETAREGRYSLRYFTGSPSGGFLFMTITQVTESDSGRYRCGLGSTHRSFEIIVADASVPSTSEPTTTQSSHSITQRSTPSSGFPEATDQSETTISTDDVTLYGGVTLAVMVVLLSVVVLIFCRKRASGSKEPPVGTERDSVTEGNRVYEDIGEVDRRNTSPRVENPSVIIYSKYTKPNGGETNDVHSFGSAASSQHQAEDDSSRLTYTEVNFSRRTDSPSSAPRGDQSEVVYSVLQVEVSSDPSHT